MAGSAHSEHDLVVLRRAAGDRLEVLMLADGDGWTLPLIESEERRSADVAELNRAARASLGVEVSALRCLSDELHRARQFLRVALPRIETSWEVRAFPSMSLRRLLGP